MKSFDFTGMEFPPLSDVLATHLKNCAICSATLERKPVAVGQRSAHCSEWFEIIRDYAEYEGTVNNIVAHDEYGNEAGNDNLDMR